MAALDWPALMRAGLVGLRLTPEAFWRLTPAELRLMLNLDPDAAPMDRDRLSRLMAAFPDRDHNTNKME
ncbi:rcc01693 family protein [Phaeobacter sp. B1627]|uniref:rcc01693 family protein n=1 Tax=Phaeobacter sp. B1627 TaxID=2583809 RepID=UPI0011188F75|nr:rcc01693 family protein [Phaeobacter sp. B1627]TNJ46727.1 phage tail assembly chaperone [Phaeobacter sp. B1627]